VRGARLTEMKYLGEGGGEGAGEGGRGGGRVNQALFGPIARPSVIFFPSPFLSPSLPSSLTSPFYLTLFDCGVRVGEEEGGELIVFPVRDASERHQLLDQGLREGGREGGRCSNK